MRWRSPVESVEEERSMVRYPSPRSISLAAVLWKASHMLRAMGRIGSGRLPGTPRTHSTRSERVMEHASSRDIPRSLGARAASDRRVPWQSGQTSSLRNFSTLFMPFSSFTLAREFSTV